MQSYEVAKGNVSTTISSTGTLENAEAESVELPEGIKIKKVYVREGDYVEEGQKLALVDKSSVAEIIIDIVTSIDTLSDELDDVDDSDDKTSTEYMERLVLKNSIKELKSEKKKLMQIYRSGKVTASTAGIIDAVNVADNTTVSEQNQTGTDSSSISMLSSDSDTAASVTLLSTDSSDNDNVTLVTDADMQALNIQTPETGAVPQSEIAETHFYTGTISWDTTGAFEAGKTYTATVILTSKAGYAFATAESYNILNDSSIASKEMELSREAGVSGNILGIKVSYAIEAEVASQDVASDSTQTETFTTDTSQSTKKKSSDVYTDTGASASTSAGTTVSSSTSVETTSSDDTTTGSVEISQTEIFAISPSDSMVLSVSVDELDINSVQRGQNAVITMDAFENSEFSGTISDIDTTATTNGGSSKYTVDITLNKEDGMLQGMSASAVITISEASMCIREQEFVGIVGPSGSGKSTMMNIIGCLDTADSGRYILNGQSIESYSENELAHIKNRRRNYADISRASL